MFVDNLLARAGSHDALRCTANRLVGRSDESELVVEAMKALLRAVAHAVRERQRPGGSPTVRRNAADKANSLA